MCFKIRSTSTRCQVEEEIANEYDTRNEEDFVQDITNVERFDQRNIIRDLERIANENETEYDLEEIN